MASNSDSASATTPRLGIGTVQFGQDYALNIGETQPGISEVSDILKLAAGAGIQVLDTASAYGDSERVLGQALGRDHEFRIVTKTASFAANVIGAADAEILTATFKASLAAMDVTSVYGLLIHNADNLLSEGGEFLYAAMERLKQDGSVENIGVSLYTAQQIERLSVRYELDIVQVPVSILDQRLIAGGQLNELRRQGVEVHARSIFLKGLIFAEPAQLPAHFDTARPGIEALREEARSQGVSLRAAALSFVLGQDSIGTVLVGLTSAKQLSEILDDARVAENAALPQADRFALNRIEHLNPALWPEFRISDS